MAKQYHKNPRQITAKQYEALAIDLAELGDLGGIVHDLNSDEIIGGNQRSRVFDLNACDVVLTEVLPEPDAQGTVAHGFVLWKGSKYAYRQVRWTERQSERANVVANKRGGSWDFDILANQFDAGDLLDWGFEPFELGLDGEPAEAGGDTEPQIDRAEELRQKWQTAAGQLWQLGEHRLICGDCTDPATVARVMAGEGAAAVFTDPPYGINYDPQFLPEIAERHNKRLSSNRTIANDDGALDLSFLWQYERRMVWGFPYIYDPAATGWIVWDKQPGVESRGIVTPIEMASTTMRKGFDMVRVMWGGFYRAAGEDKQPHPTQKPLGVYRPFIEHWTDAGDIVFDPFSGSAPVLMVCEVLGRKCRAIELDAGFTAVALERWAQHTGGTPVLLEQ